MRTLKSESNDTENPHRWQRVLFAIGLGLGLLLFTRQILLSYQALRQQEAAYLKPIYLVGSLVLSLLVYLLLLAAWVVIMRLLGVSLSFGESVRGFFLSFLSRYIPGGIWGYVSRSEWLKRSYSIEYSVSALGSILESLGLVSTAFIVTGSFVCLRSSGYIQVLLALGCAGFFVVTWLVAPRFVMKGTRKLGGNKLATDLEQAFGLERWAGVLVLDLTLWLCYGGSVLLAGNAVINTASDNVLATTFASTVSWILGFVVAFVPAGIGVRELTLSTLLSSQILHLDFLPWQADLTAVVSRLSTLSAELAWLSIGLGLRASGWWSTTLQDDSSRQSWEE